MNAALGLFWALIGLVILLFGVNPILNALLAGTDVNLVLFANADRLIQIAIGWLLVGILVQLSVGDARGS